MNVKQLAKIKIGDKVWNRKTIVTHDFTIPKRNLFVIVKSQYTDELCARIKTDRMHYAKSFPLNKFYKWFEVPVSYEPTSEPRENQ